ncbi:MAG: hypothetical protein FWC70_12775 [Defluviitaleaceae bacterium]|nr:hypothetical protein [Defluviitaleaceae bacterium]
MDEKDAAYMLASDMLKRAKSEKDTAMMSEAVSLMENAANMGHVNAQFEMAGLFQKSDAAKCLHWLKMAAENGHPRAKMFIEKTQKPVADNKVTTPTPVESVATQAVSDTGHVDSRAEMPEENEHSEAKRRVLEELEQKIEKIAREANMFETNDKKEAIYKSALDMMVRGVFEGESRTRDEASQLMESVAYMGYANAESAIYKSALDMMYRAFSTEDADVMAEALKLMETAALFGHGEAQMEMMSWHTSQGNEKGAREWLEIAAEDGHPGAQELLKKIEKSKDFALVKQCLKENAKRWTNELVAAAIVVVIALIVATIFFGFLGFIILCVPIIALISFEGLRGADWKGVFGGDRNVSVFIVETIADGVLMAFMGIGVAVIYITKEIFRHIWKKIKRSMGLRP